VSEPGVSLHLGDCLAVLPTLETGSVDAFICDPPYPEISREYGRWTEAEWHAMMRAVVGECRRILKPSGSAVFILQPNSERVGRMRAWLWEFLAWTAREWNQVQDAWWWNVSASPIGGAITDGLLRPSLKACVWLGGSDCYRDQAAVLWTETQANVAERSRGRALRYFPSGHHHRRERFGDAARVRGGVTPFNLLPIGSDARWSGGTHGHPASTPLALMDWWLRYLCPPGGTACDPFMGSGTVGLAALRRRRSFIGIEKFPAYFETARARLAGPPTPLLDGPDSVRPAELPTLFDRLPAGGPTP
jgi:hypothetical protein